MKGSIIRQNERQLLVSENCTNDRNFKKKNTFWRNAIAAIKYMCMCVFVIIILIKKLVYCDFYRTFLYINLLG